MSALAIYLHTVQNTGSTCSIPRTGTRCSLHEVMVSEHPPVKIEVVKRVGSSGKQPFLVGRDVLPILIHSKVRADEVLHIRAGKPPKGEEGLLDEVMVFAGIEIMVLSTGNVGLGVL
jgi:hypothetical protein